jgi:hypothetical protein
VFNALIYSLIPLEYDLKIYCGAGSKNFYCPLVSYGRPSGGVASTPVWRAIIRRSGVGAEGPPTGLTGAHARMPSRVTQLRCTLVLSSPSCVEGWDSQGLLTTCCSYNSPSCLRLPWFCSWPRSRNGKNKERQIRTSHVGSVTAQLTVLRNLAAPWRVPWGLQSTGGINLLLSPQCILARHISQGS